MTRHSKVFVPVSEASENSFTIYTMKEWIYVEEKENVYVLSEQELVNLMYEYYNSDDFISAELFLESKTNPQTENK